MTELTPNELAGHYIKEYGDGALGEIRKKARGAFPDRKRLLRDTLIAAANQLAAKKYEERFATRKL